MMVHTPPTPLQSIPTPCKTPSRRFLTTPTRSSPLSPRPFNTLPVSPPPTPPSFLVPKRLFKPNPLARSREDRMNARRDIFLSKVKSGREDQRWRARGGEDEMMRMIFVAEQKRWEASLERAASSIPTIYEEEEEEEEEIVSSPYEDQERETLLALANEAEDFAVSPILNPVAACDADFDELLDRDGDELEALMAEMDLDLDHNMSG